MYVNSIISYHFCYIILRCVWPHNSAVFHAKGYAAELPPEAPGHRFSYRSIRPVYTIVFIEQTTVILSKFPDTYIHRFSQMSDSGFSMNLLHTALLTLSVKNSGCSLTCSFMSFLFLPSKSILIFSSLLRTET